MIYWSRANLWIQGGRLGSGVIAKPRTDDIPKHNDGYPIVGCVYIKTLLQKIKPWNLKYNMNLISWNL
jgi:hypothetical protein